MPGFETVEVTVGGEPWLVALADTPGLRAQGLMGVADLGGLDGMLFAYPDDSTARFWMKDTLIPLDIAFFDAAGALVDLLAMVPCEAGPCPYYRAAGPYRWAVEVPAGGFDGLAEVTLGVP
ncbi:MAG: DUF192 domain-containing protein [Actinobacteria bacterium]|nr:DUF192 domain-containing protein [Actinomycetota bacterium]